MDTAVQRPTVYPSQGLKDADHGFVPLAQDMGCLEGRCSGSYKARVNK